MRPTVGSRRLGAQLRVYREAAHLDQTRVAGAIGIKQAHMSSIENSRTKISAEKLATLAAVLQIPAEAAARMEDLRARAHGPGWWQDYGDILSEPIQALIELEEDASWIRSFDGQVIPACCSSASTRSRSSPLAPCTCGSGTSTGTWSCACAASSA
jgi:transcriptional regulator with XRE-family HTH domain